MRTDRRGFFRILGGAVTSVSAAFSTARAEKGSLEIHRKTRNTRFGALGPRRPRLQSPPRPFKPYPEAERVKLPAPVFQPMLPLAEVVTRYFELAGGYADARFLEVDLPGADPLWVVMATRSSR